MVKWQAMDRTVDVFYSTSFYADKVSSVERFIGYSNVTIICSYMGLSTLLVSRLYGLLWIFLIRSWRNRVFRLFVPAR